MINSISLIFLLGDIYIRLDDKVHRKDLGIHMGTNCALLIAELFLFCNESRFMANLHKNLYKSDLINTFNNT